MPDSLHAVSCSIPTMADVIGYEEKSPVIMRNIVSGYPRFVTHRLLGEIAAEWTRRHRLEKRVLFLTPSAAAARELRQFAGPGGETLVEATIHGVHYPVGSPESGRAAAFAQHTGLLISSRRAEDYLLANGLAGKRQAETRAEESGAPAAIASRLAGLFGTETGDVVTASSGMSAFYALFRTLGDHQAGRGRNLWIQLGWLYLDTIEILRKFTGGESHRLFLPNVFDLDAVRGALCDHGRRVAGIVTELPTNPLIETPDLAALGDLARRHGVPLIVDPTLASPRNVRVFPEADAAVNSLTKYAANEGDVLGGAVVVNRDSPWAEVIAEGTARRAEPLHAADAARLAHEMEAYEATVDRMNANTLAVAEFLQNHPATRRLHWACSPENRTNYERVQRRPGSPGCMMTLELRGPLADFYDRVNIPKGPSFGTRFTLLCPFMYLAHYDLVSTEPGRRYLRSLGLEPDLIRISIGTEDPADIIAAFDEAL